MDIGCIAREFDAEKCGPGLVTAEAAAGRYLIIELLVVNLSFVAITRGNMRHGHQGPGSGHGQQITFREQSEDLDVVLCECV